MTDHGKPNTHYFPPRLYLGVFIIPWMNIIGYRVKDKGFPLER